MTLSEQDRTECLADPHSFGERLALQFQDLAAPMANGGGMPSPTTAPKESGRAGAPVSKGKRQQPQLHRATKKRSAAKRAKKSSLTPKSKRQTGREPLKCPECDKPFMTAGRLRNHMRDQHGIASVQPSSSGTAGTAE